MTRTDALDDRFDEAVRTLLDAHSVGTDNPPSRSWNPADSASRSAGTRPAADTKSGSSKTGRIV
jgi:hypothetical protein